MTKIKKDGEKEAEFPDGTPPYDMQEGVSERIDDKNEKKVEGKEAECPDCTPPDDMEEGASEKKDDRNEKMVREKRQNSQMTLLLMIWRQV